MIKCEVIENPDDDFGSFDCFGCKKPTNKAISISTVNRNGDKVRLPRFSLCEECHRELCWSMLQTVQG